MSITKKFVLLAISMLLCAGLLVAQQANAKIFGAVQLEDGSMVPGVSVTATSPKLVGKATAVTDENGTFRLLSLAPGVYKLTFALEGFQTVVREEVPLGLEQTINLKITMKLGDLKEAITVTGQTALIDVKSTAKGMTMTKEVFKSLPKGRDFSSLLSTIPGVNYEPLQGNGQGYSVDGASAAENVFYTDGMEVTDIRGGEQSQQVAFDMVEEVQVKASGYMAEFGGSMGGVINVVTRSGGNDFHGDVIGFFSPSALVGRERDTLRLNPSDTSIAEYVNYTDLDGKRATDRFDAGLAVGGPIAKDKAWFFASFLPAWSKTTRHINFLYPTNYGADFERQETWMNVQGKITATPVKDLRISLSGMNNLYKEKGDIPPPDGSGSNSFAWSDWGWDWPNYSFSGNADYTAGNNLLISAHGGYFFQGRKNGLVPTTPIYLNRRSIPAAYNIPAELWRPALWSNWGNTIDTIDGSNAKKVAYTRASAGVDFNYFMNLGGEHSWKAGFQWSRVADDINTMFEQPYVRLNFGRRYQSMYTGDIWAGRYGYYEVRQPFGTQVNNAHSDRMAVYLQDSWTIANRFTINLGIRAESEKVPAFATIENYPEFQGKVPLDFGFGDKIAPRLGFVWDVMGDSSLKVFGSFGLFHDVMKLAMPEGSYGGDLWVSSYYTLDTLQWNTVGVNNVFPGTYIESADWRYPSVEATDPGIKPMSQREISFGAEKKLSENWVISARYVNKHLLRAIEDIGFATEHGESYIIGNPGEGLSGVDNPPYPALPKAKRDYSSVNVTLDKRFSDNWTGGLSFTWSSLKGNFAGLDSADEPLRNDPNVNRYWDSWFNMRDAKLNLIDGPLPGDRPINVKVYGSYSFPFGLTIGGAAFAYSGAPVSTQFVLNSQQGFYPDNRFDTGKRTPFTYYGNLYAEYAIKLGKNQLSINVNVDNITDSKMARQVFEIYNRDLPWLEDAELLAADWDYKALTTELDNRYMKEYNFFPPIAVRFGAKFSF